MLEITKFKTEYAEILEGIITNPRENIRIFCETDVAGDMQKGSCFICVTSDEIVALSGYFANDAVSRAFIHTGEKRIPLKDIKKLRAEELISTFRIVAKTDRDDVFVAFGTYTVRVDVILFVKYVNRMLEGKGVVPEEKDFDKSLFCPKCGRRYAVEGTKICPHCSEGIGIFKKLGVFVKKYRAKIIAVLVAYVLVSLIGVIAPYFSSTFLYDKVLEKTNPFYGKLVLLVLIVAGIDIAKIFVNMFGDIITSKMGAHLVCDLKITIFESMKKLSMDFFTGRQTGGLMQQINDDAGSIYWFMVEGIPFFLVNSLQIIVVAVTMLIIKPSLAIICIAVLPLFIYLTTLTLRKQRYYHFKRYSASRRFSARLTDSFGAIRVTKTFAREKDECRKFEARTLELADASRKMTIFNNVVPPALRIVMFLTRLIVWGIGGWLVMRGEMTYGFFTAFIAYVGMLNSPLYTLADMMDQFADCENAVRRLFEIYDAEPSVREKEGAQAVQIEGAVEFRHVMFSYDKNRRIIDNVSFKVNAGEKLGIVGHSGAGKSTLANLLIRLYDTTEGEILIDGVNVREIPFDCLRNAVSIVSQETYIFSGSIYDNIAYARPNATREEVIEAARLAGAHDFIIKLIDGYQTKIGKGNQDLSGGEKQRISIARAILKNPKILILDEATASMDTKTERMIQMSLDMLSENRTTIMIAHRLSTLKNVNNLIVIEGGRLVQEGTHEELSSQEGVYKTLYDLQIDALRNVIEET